MSLAVLKSRALAGMHAPEVTVEVHLANGLPSFTIVWFARNRGQGIERPGAGSAAKQPF